MQRIAIIQDWFTTYAGSEKVIEQLLQVFPQADLFSLVDFLPSGERDFLGGRAVHTSFLQKLPFAKQHYRSYLPLMPLAIERLDVSGYDLVISNCHAVSKGVITGPGQLHISYIHTPIRYAWDMQDEYLRASGMRGLQAAAARGVLAHLRAWDRAAAQRPARLIANSNFIAGRIRENYGRSADVIYPPVDTDIFTASSQARQDFYLTASRLVPYKHVDLIAAAFRDMPDRKLVIIGDGPDASKVRRLCGPNVEWRGYQSTQGLRHAMQRCRAFIFAAKEDFGITPLEAQACGTPVIAYAAGGVRETIGASESRPPTGLFYPEQTAGSIQAAVLEFEQTPDRYPAQACRRNAERFSNRRFRREFEAYIASAWEDFQAGGRQAHPNV